MAFIATPRTIRTQVRPNLETTLRDLTAKTLNPESVNNMWTHPNPYVKQIGNHLFHKDEIPRSLKYNDQKRDKEALDNLKNRALRRHLRDDTPAFNRQLVTTPLEGTPMPYRNTVQPNSSSADYATAVAPIVRSATQMYPGVNISGATPKLPLPPNGKPFSPLATPLHCSGLPYSSAVTNPEYARYHGFINHTHSYGLDRTYSRLTPTIGLSYPSSAPPDYATPSTAVSHPSVASSRLAPSYMG